MIRHILTVSTGTLTSRILGFVRDALIAALLGAGWIADAFLVAFQFINVARRMLTEGALNAALVPGFLGVRDSEGETAAKAYAGRVLGSVTLVLIAIGFALALFMPQMIALLAPGFTGPSLQAAIDNARLMLPYFAFVGPATVMMGVLNAGHRFVLTAFSPVLFNIVMICTIGLLLVWQHDPAWSATAMAGAVGVAGCLQMLILVQRRPTRDGIATPVRISFDPQIRAFFRKATPGMLANSGPQFLIVAGAIMASSSPAAVSWLYFANRLIELPLGVVGVAMGTVLVPELSRAIRNDDRAAMTSAESRGLELAVALALPATLGLMILAQPIIRILFEHGAFTPADTIATAQALTLLAAGLPAHVLTKTLAPAFFAREDTKTPLVATLSGIAAAVLASLLIGRIAGANGVAASIAIGAWVCAIILLMRGAMTFGFSLDALAFRRLPRIVLCAAAMGAMLFLASTFVMPVMASAGFMAQITIVGGLIAAGVSFYGLLLDLFGIVSWGKAIDNLRDNGSRT